MISNLLLPLGIEVPKILSNILGINKQREKVYVVGNGWGSYYFVKNLNKNKFEPIIIAPNQKVLNTPKLTNLLVDQSATTSATETASALALALASASASATALAHVEFENPYGKIISDTVEDIDIKKKNIITKSGKVYHYNRIVLAIGSEPNDFGIEGVNTYTYKFKTIADANLLREKMEKLKLENVSSLKHVVKKSNQIYIVGSGITGIEIASKIDKIFDVKVIEGLEKILPGYSETTQLDIKYHLRQTQPNIDIKTSTMVKSIGDNFIKVNEINKQPFNNINKPIDFTKYIRYRNEEKKEPGKIIDLEWDSKKDLIIWSGGIRLNGFGAKTTLFNTLNMLNMIASNIPIKPRGIDVGEDFSFRKDLGIYCVGDMVANRGPPSAQNARLQGEYLAKYFNSGFDENFLLTNKFESITKGKLVHLLKDTYLESEYYCYNGFIYGFVDKLIEWMNM